MWAEIEEVHGHTDGRRVSKLRIGTALPSIPDQGIEASVYVFIDKPDGTTTQIHVNESCLRELVTKICG